MAGKIWEFLRSELEMDGRFKTLESKLNLIQDNLKARSGWGAGSIPLALFGPASGRVAAAPGTHAASEVLAVARTHQPPA